MRSPEACRDDNVFRDAGEARPAREEASGRREDEARPAAPECGEGQDEAGRWARFGALLAQDSTGAAGGPDDAPGADALAARRAAAKPERRRPCPERTLPPARSAPAAPRAQPAAREVRPPPLTAPQDPRRDAPPPADSPREARRARRGDAPPRRRRDFVPGALFGLLLGGLVLGGLMGTGWVEVEWSGPASPERMREALPLDRLRSLLPDDAASPAP